MNSISPPHRSLFADSIYCLLNPLPFGFFVAALIFDVIYARTAEVPWNDGAAWLNAFGLMLAIIPRVINLAQVWITSRRYASRGDRLYFWLYLLAIIVAIFNALVHSRDAYAVVPVGMWLSTITVILISIGQIVMAVYGAPGGLARE